MTASKVQLSAEPRNQAKPGIYVHIPFCEKKCNYCAFLSAPADDKTRARYVEALLEEIKLQAKCHKLGQVDSIYFGGGTPSVLESCEISRILNAIREGFDIDEDCEITLEANPGTLGAADKAGVNAEAVLLKLSEYRKMGINRLSMGVQSMNDDRLKLLGRIHDAETVRRDYKLAREAGFDNINLDIIFSIPGTDTEDALSDIKAVAELGPEHISYYSLQLEEGTPFFRKWEDGELEEVSDEVDRLSYHRGCELLEGYGYEQYEISNFAKRGRESRHNSKYWSMTEYLGLGLGASSYVAGTRIVNLSDMDEYCDAIKQGRLPSSEEHINSRHDAISEALFTGLRRCRGIRYDEIEPGWTEKDFREYYRDVLPSLESYVATGHLIMDNVGLSLTRTGLDISNRIMAELV